VGLGKVYASSSSPPPPWGRDVRRRKYFLSFLFLSLSLFLCRSLNLSGVRRIWRSPPYKRNV
jgi:hypothetical protein